MNKPQSLECTHSFLRFMTFMVKMRLWPNVMVVLQRWSFATDQKISSFYLAKYLERKCDRPFPKQLENEIIMALCRFKKKFICLCLNFLQLLAQKPNLEIFYIYSIKLFNNFHFSRASCKWVSVMTISSRVISGGLNPYYLLIARKQLLIFTFFYRILPGIGWLTLSLYY